MTSLIVVPPGRDGLEQLFEEARAYAAADLAANTRRAYGSDWNDWAAWCRAAEYSALPADVEGVALYLTARAKRLAVSTLERRLAAIRTVHRLADLPPPEGAVLRKVWSGIRKTHGRPPAKKQALLTADLKRVIDGLPDSLAGRRDRALLLIGFAGALRRSELAQTTIGPVAGDVHAVFVSRGVELHIGRAKGDQVGKGRVLGLPLGKTKYCPVRALRAWLDAAAIEAGPVFRPVDRWGRLRPGAISGQTVARVIKAACARVGLDPEIFAGHSLRRGMISEAAERGVAGDRLQRHARHASFNTTAGYIEEGETFARSAAGKVGL